MLHRLSKQKLMTFVPGHILTQRKSNAKKLGVVIKCEINYFVVCFKKNKNNLTIVGMLLNFDPK